MKSQQSNKFQLQINSVFLAFKLILFVRTFPCPFVNLSFGNMLTIIGNYTEDRQGGWLADTKSYIKADCSLSNMDMQF